MSTILRSPLYAAFVTLCGLFAGLLGSVYADEIKNAFPLVLGHGPISAHAVAFWTSALAASFLFFFAQRASEAGRRESEQRLEQRSEELAQLVRTLPPSDFLSLFRKVFWDCGGALSGTLDTPTQELSSDIVQSAIRLVLGGVAALAQKFDGAAPDVLYAANIMIFRPSEQLEPAKISELKNGPLRFSPPETDLKALSGVLTLELNLSTTTNGGNSWEPDAALVPLALAIPKEAWDAQSRRWRVLPGGPMAFCTDNLEAYIDTRTLGDWCRRYGDFPESTALAMEAYFGGESGRNIRSFASVPLKTSAGTTLGVLNVHRNQPGLLEQKEPAQQFAPLVSPFVFVLARLLGMLEERQRIGQ